MSDNVIVLEGVSKAYSSWGSSSERFWSLLTGRPAAGPMFWALSDVSLTVRRGSSLGLVGCNGAGKSTLLQIIAGTVEPTSGSVFVDGRVAPLLELGAGFNPDFTGWENVYLAATIVGIPSKDLKERTRIISEFAGIGEFMNRPVKTYSSGMFARLAFSVAVHNDPEILLIDEILSVGDLGFQQRCLIRLRELREKGVTVLFVSHSPDAVKSVCQYAIFLHQGRIVYAGTADQTVDKYLSFVQMEANKEQLAREKAWPISKAPMTSFGATLRYGTGHVRVISLELCDEQGAASRVFSIGGCIAIDVEIESIIDVEDLSLSFLVRDGTGIDILGTTTFDEGVVLPRVTSRSSLIVRFSFQNCLRPGNYGVSIAVNRVSRRDYTDNIVFDQLDGAIAFRVAENPNRPVHYKIHQPVKIRFDTRFRSDMPPGSTRPLLLQTQ